MSNENERELYKTKKHQDLIFPIFPDKLKPYPDTDPEARWAEFLANIPINPAAQIDTPLIWEKNRLISFPDFHLGTLVSSDAEPPISSISPEIQALIAKYFVDLTSAQPTGNDGGSKLDDET